MSKSRQDHIDFDRNYCEHYAPRAGFTKDYLLAANQRIEALEGALKEAKQFAVCNCEPDDDGIVRYHRNCARRLRPIIAKALAHAAEVGKEQA